MIKFSTGETVETISIFVKIEDFSGFNREVATIKTKNISYSEANRLFVDGAIWSIIENGIEYKVWNNYTKAGPITDNRDGTLIIKMGKANTSEQDAIQESNKTKKLIKKIVGKSIQSEDEANKVRKEIEEVFSAAIMEDNDKIKKSYLCKDWEFGNHIVGEVYNALGQTWECFQAYDNSEFPDIIPENSAWFTFNRPLHGKTSETARPWVKPQHGTTDIYHVGEYMIFTDGNIYKCKSDTNFSPTEFSQAWEMF